MLKRLLLGLTCIVAFSTVGVGVTDTAEAYGRWGRPWGRPAVSYYYGPPRAYYYGGYAPYRTYYRSYYGPRYYEPDYYYYGPPRGRVAFRVGW